MRGIGTGQRIHVMIIPEVAELMQREEDAAARNAAAVAAELSDSLKDGGDRQTLSENISALAASGGGSSLSRSSSSSGSGGSRSAGSSRAVSRSNSADYPSENDDDDDDNAGEESASAVAITSLAVSKVHNALQAAAALPKIASMSDFRTGEDDDDDDDDDDGNNGGSGEKYPDALLLPAPDKPPKSLVRELSEGSLSTKKVLEQIVAWLVVNSMRSEQTQWSMLCIQNVSNIYRKTAFEVMLRSAKKLVGGSTKGGGGVGDGSVASDATAAAAAAAGAAAAAASSDASSSMPEPLSFGGTATSSTSTSTSTSGGGASSEGGEIMGVALDASSGEALCQLTPRECVGVFEEDIDFSLEAAVPDPMPFEAKLRAMLDDNEAFIVDAIGHAVGAGVLAEVSE